MTEKEWYELYHTAKVHTVQGLLFDVVKSLPATAGMPKQLAAEWMLEAGSIENDYARKTAFVNSQRSFWERNGVNAILQKGISVAVMYRVPEHRITGDVDWWMPGRGNWNKALELVKNKGLAITLDSDGDCSYSVNGIVVEHHKNGFTENGAIGTLLMLSEHILHHAMVTGIGMRHICDMAVAYNYYHGQYDAGEYLHCLKLHGMYRWNDLLNETLKKMLGTPSDILPCPNVDVPSADVDRFVALIMRDGNFGFQREKRFSALHERFGLFMKYAPWLFVKRWIRLAMGRIHLLYLQIKTH